GVGAGRDAAGRGLLALSERWRRGAKRLDSAEHVTTAETVVEIRDRDRDDPALLHFVALFDPGPVAEPHDRRPLEGAVAEVACEGKDHGAVRADVAAGLAVVTEGAALDEAEIAHVVRRAIGATLHQARAALPRHRGSSREDAVEHDARPPAAFAKH